MMQPETEMTEQAGMNPMEQDVPQLQPEPAAPEPAEMAAAPSAQDDSLPQTLEWHDWAAEQASAPALSWHDVERQTAGMPSVLSPAGEAQDYDAEEAASTENASAAELLPAQEAETGPAPEPPSAMAAEPEPAKAAPAAEPAAEPDDAHRAKDAYWQRVLTGNPDTLPRELWERAGVADASLSPEEREYELMGAINRSWVADYTDHPREQIISQWPSIRADLADELGVAEDETEIFAGLSASVEEEQRLQRAETIYTNAYRAALLGAETAPQPALTLMPEAAAEEELKEPWDMLRAEAHRNGSERRRQLLPLAQKLGRTLSAYHSLERATPWDAYLLASQSPMMKDVLCALAGMSNEQRSEVYEIALADPSVRSQVSESESLVLSMIQSVKRGVVNLQSGLVQFAGNLAAATAHGIGYLPGAGKLQSKAERADAFLRVMEEMRHVAQERVNPIRLKGGTSLPQQLLMDMAEATPMAITAMSGQFGTGLSLMSGIGNELAEVRQRATDGSMELQTGAGILSMGIQMAFSAGLSKVGGSLFTHRMSEFLRARESGAKGYVLKAARIGSKPIRHLLRTYSENRIGRGSDLGLQELVARINGTASNIEWKEYGNEWSNIELNMREAARNLPFVLIGSGRVALHHFRQPEALLNDKHLLDEWGVNEAAQARILSESDVRKQGRLLYAALHNGKRWGGLGFLQDAARSLRLLHTDDCRVFNDNDAVRDFMQLPPTTEAEKARPVSMGKADDPAEFITLRRRHARGTKVTDPKAAMPFLMMCEEWRLRAYPEDLQGYPKSDELVPPELTKVGDHRPQTEKQRREALEKTVRYLDALTYRFLMNNTSFSTLVYAKKSPEVMAKETEDLRHKLIGKVAETVLAQAGGQPKEVAAEVYGKFISDFYTKARFSRGLDSWMRFEKPANLAEIPHKALTRRILARGPVLRQGKYPQLQQAYWVVQGIHNCVQSLVRLLPYQEDFQTALSRGMTPQEAYAHLLHRELGSRLPKDGWFPQEVMADATDRAAFTAKNEAKADMYRRLTGTEPESREGDDGRTYWRIMKPDGHYTRWHDSREHCINDLAGDCRLRFLQLGGDMPETLHGATKAESGYDADQLGMKTAWRYSYFDRLSGIATGDLTRFWQEDATRMIPGLEVEAMLQQSEKGSNPVDPLLFPNEDHLGMYRAEARNVRTPYSLAKTRFNAYWRSSLATGWLDAKKAADFLLRRGAIDQQEYDAIMEKGVPKRRGKYRMTFEDFLHGGPVDRRYFPYADVQGMHDDIARHLTQYTTGYFLAHLKDMPMPPTVREWFGLAPFRLEQELYRKKKSGKKEVLYRKIGGRNVASQNMHWTHSAAAEQIQREMEFAERIRADETSGEKPLVKDAFFPTMLQALMPSEARRHEQGWAYAHCGGNVFLRTGPDMFNLLAEPLLGWKLLDSERQDLLRQRIGLKRGAEPVPPELKNLDDVLRAHPELHRYELIPGKRLRYVVMDIKPYEAQSYPRYDSVYDHPDYAGDDAVSSGFNVRAVRSLPATMSEDKRVMPALRTLAKLRRAVHDFPYREDDGIWWKGERYGGVDGRKLDGMDETWTPQNPMAEINRIFDSIPADSEPLMTFGNEIEFGPRTPLPDAFNVATTIYRSPVYPLSQLRIMPGENNAVNPNLRSPYVVHSFIGAPVIHGVILPNTEKGRLFATPLDRYWGDVTREFSGHMAGFRGKEALYSCLEDLMQRTESAANLEASRSAYISNREILMQLTEDSRFSRSLEGKEAHELDANEALAATWFRTLAEYEYGSAEVARDAAERLLRINRYFTTHPKRLEAVTQMLDHRRLQYGSDPNDLWKSEQVHALQNRALKRRREELEIREFQRDLRRRQKENPYD